MLKQFVLISIFKLFSEQTEPIACFILRMCTYYNLFFYNVITVRLLFFSLWFEGHNFIKHIGFSHNTLLSMHVLKLSDLADNQVF